MAVAPSLLRYRCLTLWFQFFFKVHASGRLCCHLKRTASHVRGSIFASFIVRTLLNPLTGDSCVIYRWWQTRLSRWKAHADQQKLMLSGIPLPRRLQAGCTRCWHTVTCIQSTPNTPMLLFRSLRPNERRGQHTPRRTAYRCAFERRSWGRVPRSLSVGKVFLQSVGASC